MEDRIFGTKIDTSNGNVLTRSDMENTYLEQGVTYSVSYPVSGIELLKLGSWESNAVESIIQKFDTQGCVPTYISLDSLSNAMIIQFKFMGAYTKTVFEAISFIVTFGVTPLITLSKPDMVEVVATSTIIRDIPPGVIVGGSVLVFCIIGYVLLEKHHHR